MNTAKARIKHHTITGTASPFTAPSNLDFTGGNWIPTDLYPSELGVNTFTDSIYVRIGDEIREIITDATPGRGKYIDIFGGSVGNQTTGAAEVLYSVTLPGDYFADQTGFYIRAGVRTATNADPKEFTLQVAGEVVYTSTADTNNPNDGRFFVDFDFIRTGTSATSSPAAVSGSSQISLGTFSNADFNVGVGLTNNIDWTQPIDVEIVAEGTNVDDIELFTVKIYDIK